MVITDFLGGGIFKGVKDIISSFKLDPEVKAKLEDAIDQRSADFRLKELELNAQIQEQISAQVIAQIEVNKEDSKGNAFQAGWRPLIGYICGAGLAYQFLGQPLLSWASGIWHIAPAPAIDAASLFTLLAGMLGLGALRTQEKLKDKD